MTNHEVIEKSDSIDSANVKSMIENISRGTSKQELPRTKMLPLYPDDL